MARLAWRETRRLWPAILAVLLLVGGLTTAPAGADGHEAPGEPLAFRSITRGARHTCALLDNGSVKCWGWNLWGQLGLGDADDRGDGPTDEMGDALPVVDLGADVTALSAGGAHTCALLDDSSVKCWGINVFGELGQGDTAARGDQAGEMGANLPPVDLGAGRFVTAVSGGDSHTCALLDDGSVKCWGLNAWGQLGLGDTAFRGDGAGEMGDALLPVDLGPGRTATAVSAGGSHTCALLDNGSVKCWGQNSQGQLGLGNTSDRGDGPGEMGDALPAVDLGAGLTAQAISAGGSHTCALLNNNTVRCWGANSGGQLGYGDTNARGDGAGEMGALLLPVQLGTGLLATGLSAGVTHTCVLTNTLRVKCWGENFFGGLGLDEHDHRGDGPGEMGDSLPTVALGPGRTATAVTTGNYGGCARLDNDALKCWGWNNQGQLGLGDTLDRGYGPHDMGSALPAVDLGVLPASIEVTLTVTGATSVVAGEMIDFDVDVQNTGERRLTQVQVHAPEVPGCALETGQLAPGQTITSSCQYETTDADAPQKVAYVAVSTAQGAFDLSNTQRVPVAARRYRPDAQIRRSGAFAGNNVYNANGASQTRTATVPNLGTATFTVRVQNDGNTTEAFKVKGPGSTSRYTVTYRDGATNVTSQVVAGTFTTNPLAPGASQDLTLVIKAKAGAPPGNAISRLVTVSSATTPTIKDAVKATVTRT